MNLTTAGERRLEAAILDRLRHVLTPTIREAITETLHGGRRTLNGIREPGPGKCRDVWDMLDAMDAPAGVTLAMAQQAGAAQGLNVNNVRVEFYRWRMFNGYNDTH